MDAAEGSASKVCVVCGQNCASRGRLKDRRGRYMCRACFELHQAQREPPPATAVQALKVCSVCGQDCSRRDRLKNRAGRYTCRECFEVLRSRALESGETPASARAQAPAQIEPKPAAIDPSACPGCGERLPRKAVLCLACGYNRATGTFTGPIIVNTSRRS